MSCFNYKDGYDTGGNPIMKRHCECDCSGCIDMELIKATEQINYGKVLTPAFEDQEIDWKQYYKKINLI